jgi:hypothetical protein
METWELAAREACRDTLAQYTHSGDRFLLEQLAEAFCEDGVLEVRGDDPVVGRKAIIERLARGRGSSNEEVRAAAKAEQSAGTRRMVRHNIANIRFEAMAPTEATVASYFTVITEIGLDHIGRYRDRMVPVAERWLLAHRFVSVDWHAPNSTFRRSGPA